jgi:hypothetical protein
MLTMLPLLALRLRSGRMPVFQESLLHAYSPRDPRQSVPERLFVID